MVYLYEFDNRLIYEVVRAKLSLLEEVDKIVVIFTINLFMIMPFITSITFDFIISFSIALIAIYFQDMTTDMLILTKETWNHILGW